MLGTFFMINLALGCLAVVLLLKTTISAWKLRGALNSRSRKWLFVKTGIGCSLLAVLYIGSIVAEKNRASEAGFESIDAYRTHVQEARILRLDAEKKARAEAKARAEIEAQTPKNCGSDLNCIYEEHHIEASVQCGKEIEKMAKYQSKWTTGLTSPTFSNMKWKSQKSGIATFIGDRVQFQNGFGAWQNYIYFCDYDIRSSQAVNVVLKEGRI